MPSFPESSGPSRSGSDPEESPACWIVVGLGNPGEEYGDTYHNVGFRVVEVLAERCSRANWSKPGEVGMIPARVVEAVFGDGNTATLVQPWTYMNRTGRILPRLFDRYGLDSRLLVVSDDLALPVGKIRIRERGSAGGHNGLESISSAYGSERYCRVRVGIGSRVIHRDTGPSDTRDYVLSRVRRPDREILTRAEALAAEAVEYIVCVGVAKAMARFNGMDLGIDPEDPI